MDGDFITKVTAGLGAIGAALYGVVRMVKKDRRDDTMGAATDAAVMQVIETLRAEVDRLSVRLAAVEEQNRRCEARNDALQQELIELKAKLHVT